jgi:hypothetical protein
MGTVTKNEQRVTHVASREESSKQKNKSEVEAASERGSTLGIRHIAIAVGFGVIGCALCGAVIGIGSQAAHGVGWHSDTRPLWMSCVNSPWHSLCCTSREAVVLTVAIAFVTHDHCRLLHRVGC